MTGPNLKSSVFLRNLVETDSITVTPVLFLSNGTELDLSPVTLTPAGTAVLDVNASLQSKGIAPYATLSGYVEVRYAWPWNPICMTIRNLDPVHSLIFTFGSQPKAGSSPPVTGPTNPPHELDSVWWLQEKQVGGFVALSNASATSIAATVITTDDQGAVIADHSVTVSSHGTKLVDLNELQGASSTSGGIHVTYSAPSPSLLAYGGLQDFSSGYSASLVFSTPPGNNARPSSMSYAALGLMKGPADPMMNFPSGTTFTPYAVFRNLSSAPATIAPTLWWMSNGNAQSFGLPSFTLASGKTHTVDFQAAISLAGLSNYYGNLNLVADVSSISGAVMLAAGSVDQTNNYVFEVSPRGVLPSGSKSLSYWSIGNGDDTMVTTWNPADEAQDLVFKVFFVGGQYNLPLHLGPRETRTLSLSEIIQAQIPDVNGHIIPEGVHEGSAKLAGSIADNQQILIASDVGVYNVKKATCGEECYTCDGATSSSMSPSPFFVETGQSIQMSFQTQWDTGEEYDLSDSATWNGGGPISVSSTGQVTGVFGDSANVSASDSSEPLYMQYCGPAGPDPCPLAFGIGAGASGQVGDATPNITSLSPGVWDSGNTTSVTIFGTGFGTNQPTLAFSDSTITGTASPPYSDSQIVASVTVPPGTLPESVTVTVTSGGDSQYGNGFYSGGGGQSPTSPSSPPASVVIPCPTGISYNPNGGEVILLRNMFPQYKTGVGIVAEMDVSGPNDDYKGAKIVESLSNGSNNCTSYGIAACGSTASTFSVGSTNKAVDGNTQGPTKNAFYDNHVTLNANSILPPGASCQTQCSQQYSCNNVNIGPKFTITRSYSTTTYSGTPVTVVTTSKQ